MKKKLLTITMFVALGLLIIIIILNHNKTDVGTIQNNIIGDEANKINTETEKKEIGDYYLMKNALKTKNDIYCKKLKNGSYDQCVYSIAIYYKDGNFCQKINDSDLKKACFENLKLEEAIKDPDINKCFDLEIDKFRKQCLKSFFVKYYSNIDKCKEFTGNIKEFCESVVYRNIAILEHNKGICYKIIDDDIKNSCLSEIKETKTLLDSDFDGLSDSEELSYGTDPFSKDTDNDGLLDKEELEKYHTNPCDEDTDGDGYGDGDEVKNGFNPLGEGEL